jgi:hypothetical protein
MSAPERRRGVVLAIILVGYLLVLIDVSILMATIAAVAKPTGPIEPCGCRRVACPVLSRACCLDVKR